MTIRMNTYCQMFFAFLFLLVLQGTAVAENGPYPYTGEQLFQGIYFSDGPVANEVKVLRENSFKNRVKDREALMAAKKFQSEIMTRITRKHPNFFNEFGQEIASRNHTKILKALENANTIFYSAITGLMYEKTGQAKAGNTEEELKELRKFLDSYAGSGKAEQRTESSTIEQEQNLIAVALVWVLAVAWEYAWVSDKFVIPNAAKMDQSGGLHKEQLVQQLADL